MTTTQGTGKDFGSTLVSQAMRIRHAPPEEKPRRAMELLEQFRRNLRDMSTIALQQNARMEGRRVILATFHDSSCASIRQRDGVLIASPGLDPAIPGELTGPDGKPLTMRELMDNLQPRVTTAKKVIEAHLGPCPHNPLDQNGLESAAWEADRHALYVMHRLPREYRDCFQHLGEVARSSPHTALLPDGSRVAWVRPAGYGKELRWQSPLAVAAIPPDPRWMKEELELRGDCTGCGGPALEGINARRVRAQAYGLEVDEIFCLVCTGGEHEFAEH